MSRFSKIIPDERISCNLELFVSGLLCGQRHVQLGNRLGLTLLQNQVPRELSLITWQS